MMVCRGSFVFQDNTWRQEDRRFTAETPTQRKVAKPLGGLTDPLRIGAPGSRCRRDAGQATPGRLRLRLEHLASGETELYLLLPPGGGGRCWSDGDAVSPRCLSPSWTRCRWLLLATLSEAPSPWCRPDSPGPSPLSYRCLEDAR